MESASQRKTKSFTGHGENIQVGLADRRFKILASPRADIDDIALAISQYGGRGIVLQE